MPSTPTLCLPADEPTERRAARADAVAAQRRAYGPWDPVVSHDGTPRPRDLDVRFTLRGPTLPARERFWGAVRSGTHIGLSMSMATMSTRWRLRRTAAPRPRDLREAYLPMFSADERVHLPLGGATLNDAGFALQRLYGTSPYQLQRLDAWPDHLRLTDADVAGALPDGATLDGLLRGRALYAVDTTPMFGGLLGTPILDEAGLRTAPTSVFALHGEALAPVAIQLRPDDAAVFTPQSAPGGWLAAKLFANQAEIVSHVAGLHTAGVWAFGQAFVAMRRTMSLHHPIQALAWPWSRTGIATKALLRVAQVPSPPWKHLSGPLGGRYWERFRLDDFHLPRRCEARGVDALPVFPWRDNLLDVWGAMHRFVGRIVHVVYADDGALAGDVELQAWAAMLHDPQGCHLRSSALEAAGGRFATRDDLVDVLTTLLFFVSVWHGYDAYHWPWFAWIPSSPIVFDLPVPAPGDDVGLDAILGALSSPSSPQAIEQKAGVIAVRRQWHRCGLTSGGPDADFVPPMPGYLDGLPGARAHVRAWFAELDALEKTFAARDRAWTGAGHLPAPAATWPSNCAGSLWY